MIFLKEFFEKVDFEKNQETKIRKKDEKFPRRGGSIGGKELSGQTYMLCCVLEQDILILA